MRRRFILSGMLLIVLAIHATASLEDRIHYLYPKPGAAYINPQTSLILRLENASAHERPVFEVTGEKSGIINGVCKTSGTPPTYLFYPDEAFEPGESVSVTIRLEDRSFSYSFTTGRPAPFPAPVSFGSGENSIRSPKSAARSFQAYGEPTILPNGVSVPSDFMYVDVTVNTSPDTGKFFLNNRPSMPYLLILNNDGTPYWYRRTPVRQRDFKVQSNGMLTAQWGYQTPYGYIGMDSTYAVVDTFYAGPGYVSCEHELQVMPNGNYLIIVLDYFQYDLSTVIEGGMSNAYMILSLVQELDKDDQVIFTWNPLDHFDVADMRVESFSNTFRYPHLNSIDVDDDGNLVISSRHMSEVTKINRQTGDIIWRLGGNHSDFTFVDDPLDGFSGQHAARVLGDGHYLMFDNGNEHSQPQSRAVEYALDTLAMTATMVWEYRNEPGTVYSSYMGNAQRLPNGNTLINWAIGPRPKATEVTADGEKVYEMNYESHDECYRTQKFNWNVPAKTPYLIIESGARGATLLFNQFGDPDVDYYRIYHGTSPDPTALLDTSRLTMKKFDNLENKAIHFFRVTSVSKTGQESGYSNQEGAIVKIIEPGENQVLNDDFSQGDNFWGLSYYGSVDMEGSVVDSVFHLKVSAINGYGGAYLYQYPVELIRNETYVMEFDVWSNVTLQVQPLVATSNGQTDFARIGAIQVTPQREHHSYEFTKRSSSTSEAVLAFLMEISGDLYVDNVVLKQVVTGVEQEQSALPGKFMLYGNYPNPFNGRTTFRFDVPSASEVTFTLYDILGRRIREIGKGSYQAGAHRIAFEDGALTSGVYFCRMEARDRDGHMLFRDVRKMMLMK
ncbi:aryl-sulfate sulfotransferase [bacterium]|nr:aryl-sulfate sulfotransferase [bacterium]